jgi:hypothetical protein
MRVLADEHVVGVARNDSLLKQDLFHFVDVVAHAVVLDLDLRPEGQLLPVGHDVAGGFGLYRQLASELPFQLLLLLHRNALLSHELVLLLQQPLHALGVQEHFEEVRLAALEKRPALLAAFLARQRLQFVYHLLHLAVVLLNAVLFGIGDLERHHGTLFCSENCGFEGLETHGDIFSVDVASYLLHLLPHQTQVLLLKPIPTRTSH